MKGMAVMGIITKTCKDCGVTFDVTPKEQEWYKTKHFQIPERCPQCRKARRQQKNQHQQ